MYRISGNIGGELNLVVWWLRLEPSWAWPDLREQNGRLGCKPILGFILAGYVIPLNLGSCNVRITINTVNTCCTCTDFGEL